MGYSHYANVTKVLKVVIAGKDDTHIASYKRCLHKPALSLAVKAVKAYLSAIKSHESSHSIYFCFC